MLGTGSTDRALTDDEAREIVGAERADFMREKSLAIYEKAREYALERGIIIADTKFEFGVRSGEVILIDEVLTPDSSRLWPKDSYTPGRTQLSFDKQFVRDYLEAIGWDKRPPGPAEPPPKRDGLAEALTRVKSRRRKRPGR